MAKGYYPDKYCNCCIPHMVQRLTLFVKSCKQVQEPIVPRPLLLKQLCAPKPAVEIITVARAVLLPSPMSWQPCWRCA